MMLVRGSLVLATGVALTLLSIAIGSLPGPYAASVVAGIGFGPAFSGIVRSLAPLAPPDRRGALFAAMFVVLYLSLSLPAIAAGLAVARVGLPLTTHAFGLAAIVLASLTALAIARSSPSAADKGASGTPRDHRRSIRDIN